MPRGSKAVDAAKELGRKVAAAGEKAADEVAKVAPEPAAKLAKAAGKAAKAAAKPESGAKPEKASKKAPAPEAPPSDKATKAAKAGKAAKAATAGKADKAEKAEKAEKTEKAAKPSRKIDGAAGDRFLEEQRELLAEERAAYVAQAADLKAEADQLAQEMEPGDIQFDDESGEGGTAAVDRERDLALSAQARVEVDEIDHALAKLGGGSYGICESCGQPIPRARLKALPHARLCVACKSGGLSRR